MWGRRSKALVATLAIAALGLASCGDDDDGGGTAAGESAGGEGDSAIEAVTSPPDDMTVTEPLPTAPEPKSVAFVNCPVPSPMKIVTLLSPAATMSTCPSPFRSASTGAGGR